MFILSEHMYISYSTWYKCVSVRKFGTSAVREANVIQVNIKSLWDSGRVLARHLSNVDLTEYPDELRFLDAGKVGDYWAYFEDYETRNYNKCFAHAKHDEDEQWEAFDEILSLIQWVAEGKYRPVPSPPADQSPYRYYRKSSVEPEGVSVADGFPAQLRVSTPGTYLGPDLLHYIHVKIEQKSAGETDWTVDEGPGLHDVLRMLETGAYDMEEPDIDKPERIFRRLY